MLANSKRVFKLGTTLAKIKCYEKQLYYDLKLEVRNSKSIVPISAMCHEAVSLVARGCVVATGYGCVGFEILALGFRKSVVKRSTRFLYVVP
jgi:hypothetical protein